MPNQIGMRLRWALASTAAFIAASSLCAPAQAIVNGTTTDIGHHPYQVALVLTGKSASDGQFCGGSIRDATHVVTAAHCVFDNPYTAQGQPFGPRSIDVVAGLSTLSKEASTPTVVRSAVVDVSLNPGYSEVSKRDDAAILTLDPATPLPSGNPRITPISIVGATDWPKPVGTPLMVTGWGDLGNGEGADTLQQAAVPLIADTNPTCTRYPGFNGAAMVCAGDGVRDACFGDSGGPLVLPASGASGPVAADTLVGIVSFGGPTCADPQHPGVYTEAASMRPYLGLAAPPSAPRNTTAPLLTGVARVGQTVSCNPGTWSDPAARISTQFESHASSPAVARTALGSQTSYVVQPADVGGAIDCIVRASNGGGYAYATSAPSAVVPAPSPTKPAPAPVPPTPAPTPVPPKPPVQVDPAAPVARITSRRCKANRCTINVLVSDAGFSAGIAGVQAKVRSTYRTTCVRKHRRVACTKSRTRRLAGKTLSATRFRITASRLPFGRNAFAIVATDRAGHIQALPTRVTLVTRRPKKKR
jgi:secreted trypsin-like serine protease